MLTRTLAEHVLGRDLGGPWEVSANSGSLGNTRLAVSGDISMVLKLGQPVAALHRNAHRTWRHAAGPGFRRARWDALLASVDRHDHRLAGVGPSEAYVRSTLGSDLETWTAVGPHRAGTRYPWCARHG